MLPSPTNAGWLHLNWMRTLIALSLALAGCSQPQPWQHDAVVFFADRGVLLGDRYVRPEASIPVEGSILEDLKTCGVTRFDVFDFTGWQTDTDEFHVVAPRAEVTSSLGCLKGKLPAGVHVERYQPTAWPEGRR